MGVALDAGAATRLVALLDDDCDPDTITTAHQAITNALDGGRDEAVDAFQKAGAFPRIYTALRSSDPRVVDSAVAVLEALNTTRLGRNALNSHEDPSLCMLRSLQPDQICTSNPSPPLEHARHPLQTLPEHSSHLPSALNLSYEARPGHTFCADEAFEAPPCGLPCGVSLDHYGWTTPSVQANNINDDIGDWLMVDEQQTITGSRKAAHSHSAVRPAAQAMDTAPQATHQTNCIEVESQSIGHVDASLGGGTRNRAPLKFQTVVRQPWQAIFR
jgi:hypothetical protein